MRPVRWGLHPPPRIPIRTGVSWSLMNSAHFAGVSAGSPTGRAVSVVNEGRPEAVSGLWSLASEIRFPVRGEGRGQRLGLHATETGLRAGDSRAIGLGYDGHAEVEVIVTTSDRRACRLTGL